MRQAQGLQEPVLLRVVRQAQGPQELVPLRAVRQAQGLQEPVPLRVVRQGQGLQEPVPLRALGQELVRVLVLQLPPAERLERQVQEKLSAEQVLLAVLEAGPRSC